jgi:hypothetical protein
MRPFGFRTSGTSEKSGHAVHVAPESRMSLGLQEVRHQSCGNHDALSISRNCIDCFERPTCQMHGSNQMRFRQAMIAAISSTLLACLWTYLHTVAAWPSDGRDMMRVFSSAG